MPSVVADLRAPRSIGYIGLFAVVLRVAASCRVGSTRTAECVKRGCPLRTGSCPLTRFDLGPFTRLFWSDTSEFRDASRNTHMRLDYTLRNNHSSGHSVIGRPSFENFCSTQHATDSAKTDRGFSTFRPTINYMLDGFCRSAGKPDFKSLSPGKSLQLGRR